MVTLTNHENRESKMLPSQKAYHELQEKAIRERRLITAAEMIPIHEMEHKEFLERQVKEENERQKKQKEQENKEEQELNQFLDQVFEEIRDRMDDPDALTGSADECKKSLRKIWDAACQYMVDKYLPTNDDDYGDDWGESDIHYSEENFSKGIVIEYDKHNE